MTTQKQGSRFRAGKTSQQPRTRLRQRRWRYFSKVEAYIYVLLCGLKPVPDSQVFGPVLSDPRWSNSQTDPSHQSYTVIRPGSRVVNGDDQQPHASWNHVRNPRILYQKTGRAETDTTMEYRDGRTVLSVRNSVHPIYPSSSTGGSDPAEDILRAGALERRIAAERALTQKLLEGLSSTSISRNYLGQAAKAKQKNSNERSDNGLDQRASADTYWSIPVRTLSNTSSEPADSRRTQEASVAGPSLHQEKYVPYSSDAHKATQKVKPNGQRTPPPRPKRPHRYSAVHPDGLVVEVEPVGVALGGTFRAPVSAAKLPAHILKVRSKRTSRHPDGLHTRRESSQLQRAQQVVSQTSNRATTDVAKDRNLVPRPLRISKSPLGQAKSIHTNRASLDLDKPLPATPTKRNSHEMLERLIGQWSASAAAENNADSSRPWAPMTTPRLMARIPSPGLHLDFSADVDTQIRTSDLTKHATMTVATSPLDLPLNSSTTLSSTSTSKSANSHLNPGASHKPLPPSPHPSIANFKLSLFSLSKDAETQQEPQSSVPTITPASVPALAIVPPSTRTSATKLSEPSLPSEQTAMPAQMETQTAAELDTRMYEAYQPRFAPVPNELRANRRRGRLFAPPSVVVSRRARLSLSKEVADGARQDGMEREVKGERDGGWI